MAMPVGCVLSLAWNNPYTRDEAPFGPTLWAVTIIDPGVERHEANAWMRQACPEQRPGDGYSPTWQPTVGRSVACPPRRRLASVDRACADACRRNCPCSPTSSTRRNSATGPGTSPARTSRRRPSRRRRGPAVDDRRATIARGFPARTAVDQARGISPRPCAGAGSAAPVCAPPGRRQGARPPPCGRPCG